MADVERKKKLAHAIGSHRIRLRRVAKLDNWPYYAIGDKIVADDIIRRPMRGRSLHAWVYPVEIYPCEIGYSQTLDSFQLLTPELVERIAVLHKREIEAFGYAPPI